MKSRVFNRRIIVEFFRQIMPTGCFVSLVTLLLGMFTVAIQRPIRMAGNMMDENFVKCLYLDGFSAKSLIVLMLVVVPFMVLGMNMYNHEKKRKDFYLALPTGRKALFTGCFIAVELWILIFVGVFCSALAIMAAVYNDVRIDGYFFKEVLLQGIIVGTYINTLFSMASLIGNSLVENYSIGISVFTIFRLALYCMVSVVNERVRSTWVALAYGGKITRFNLIMNNFTNTARTDNESDFTKAIIYTLIEILIMFVIIALLLNSKSKAIQKKNSFANVLGNVVVFFPATIILLLAVMSMMFEISSFSKVLFTILLVVAIIVYISCGLMHNRGAAHIKKQLLGIPVLLLVGVVFYVVSIIAVKVEGKFVPVAGDIDKVLYYPRWYDSVNGVEIKDEALIGKLCDFYCENAQKDINLINEEYYVYGNTQVVKVAFSKNGIRHYKNVLLPIIMVEKLNVDAALSNGFDIDMKKVEITDDISEEDAEMLSAYNEVIDTCKTDYDRAAIIYGSEFELQLGVYSLHGIKGIDGRINPSLLVPETINIAKKYNKVKLGDGATVANIDYIKNVFLKSNKDKIEVGSCDAAALNTALYDILGKYSPDGDANKDYTLVTEVIIEMNDENMTREIYTAVFNLSESDFEKAAGILNGGHPEF